MKRVVLLLLIPFLLFATPVEAEMQPSLQEEIIYDILVDRFNNGDPTLSEQVNLDDPLAYYGGDLRGIIKKLDNIKKLGFTAISLSPIMENAPNGYHGYWIEDFYDVEEQIGTMDDFNELVEEAHKRDLKVILEFVTNYVSTSHSIATDPDKKDWIKENTVEPIASTTWLDHVAVLNQDNEEVQSFLLDVAEFWIEETNIDGFKIHAAEQSTEAFLAKLTNHIKDINPDFYLLASILNKEDGIEKVRENPEIGAIENELIFEKMNEMLSQVENPVSIIYEAWEENERSDDLLYVDNKNTARFANNVADNGRSAFTAWKLALTYMYTAPGVPIIYQGSELPMYGPGFPDNQDLVQFNSTDPDLEEFHNRISAVRTEFPVLSYGDFEQVGTSGAMSLFKRTYEDETMYIAINNDSKSQSVSITGIDSNMQLRGLLGDNTVRDNGEGEFTVGIPRETAEVYIIEENTGFNWWLIGFTGGVFLLFIIIVARLSYKQKKRS